MADLQRTIEILFNGVDNVSTTMRDIGGGVEKFGDSLADIGEPFTNITKGVLALDAAIAGLAVAALAANSKIEQESTKMANALGLPTAEAERFKEVALDVYQAGIGESLEDAFGKATNAATIFRNATESELEAIITKSEKLSSTFGTDYSENLSAVQTLMKNFGISSDEAFDLIATGFQKGLNNSGDFLESINEYSTQFSNGGADAGQFFSILETGFQNGVLGTDKAADIFKEFRVRIQDDSKTTKDALESIGIDPVQFAKDLDSGKMSAIEAFNIISQKIAETDDKGVQFRAGVGLMGTQFEDMGTQAALAVDTTKTKLEDLKGTMDKINPDESLSKKFETAFRAISTTIADADLFDGLGDDLGGVLDNIKNSFEEAFKNVDFTALEKSLSTLFDTISDSFGDMDLDLTSVEGMENAIQLVVDSIESLVNVSTGIASALLPIVEWAISALDWFNQLSPKTQEVIGYITGLGTAIGLAGGALAAGGALISGLGSLAGFFGSGSVLATGISALLAILTGPAGLAVALAVVATAIAGYTMSDMNDEHDKFMQKAAATNKKLDELYGKVRLIGDSDTRIEIMALIEKRDFEAAQQAIDKWVKEDKENTIRIKAETKEFDDYWTKLNKLPEEKKTQILAAINKGDFQAVEALLDNIPDEKQVTVLAKSKDIDKVKKEFEIVGKRADGSPIYAEITAKGKDIDKVKKDINAIPSEKMLEIKLQGDIDKEIAKIKADADIMQNAVEWTAKLKIAEAESAATILKSAFDGISQSVVSLSSSVSSMFSDLMGNWGKLGSLDQDKFMKILQTQQDAQNQALQSQIQLNDAQVQYLQQKANALSQGNGLIQIDCSGVEPTLQMIMWEIIKKVQIEASQDSAALLLGIP